MTTIVHIADDFDMEKIRTSGQCFRVSRMENGAYRFIAGNRVLFLCETGEEKYEASCTHDEWETHWHPYFDLDRNYAAIRKRCMGKSEFIDMAMGYGRGLRILKQDAWEMLITFIISQRKSMPAIASAVEALCERFGSPIETKCGAGTGCDACSTGTGDTGTGSTGANTHDTGTGNTGDAGADARSTIYAFPTPEQLASASEDDLRACSLGYRAPYIAQTTRQVLSGEIDLDALSLASDAELFEKLQCAHGVGAKVANCVCLFGYGRTSQVPIDVWIARAINEECDGQDPFDAYGQDAGIMQQYVFYYMTSHK